ncbi:hypothetical protein BC826DRAFT_182079 [Russula brevipes]|nr:hypothetical protein BC826DRAFT_182079 [Russula brevipes]
MICCEEVAAALAKCDPRWMGPGCVAVVLDTAPRLEFVYGPAGLGGCKESPCIPYLGVLGSGRRSLPPAGGARPGGKRSQVPEHGADKQAQASAPERDGQQARDEFIGKEGLRKEISQLTADLADTERHRGAGRFARLAAVCVVHQLRSPVRPHTLSNVDSDTFDRTLIRGADRRNARAQRCGCADRKPKRKPPSGAEPVSLRAC